ncbi:hypothetical protein AB205_0180970 [Aquarana catesbeiana]|uniref:Uncharacterized protein n=1 Tax=Aquarana catesbeiana TaxID=8400 RepID=A0A2G9Q6B5_AQUCT|nr:hypothetical protein AB205_0180970 [Aquarana catesbeiana]
MPEPEMSGSRRRRFKASIMSFGEMLEMVDILKNADYDGKYGPYPNPNVRKAKIMVKVVKSLHRNFGVRRSKDQLRKRWSDLKLLEHEQYRKIRRVLKKREKRLGGHPSSEETTDPPPLEEGEIPPTQEEQEEEDVVELVTTTGDREVVDEDPFTSESAQILIGEIMGCNLELENLKKNINDVIQKNKNIIDVLGRV